MNDVTFTARCPAGHRNAEWTATPVTVKLDNQPPSVVPAYQVDCWGCDPLPYSDTEPEPVGPLWWPR